jgi:ATP-binding cassette subfamily B protein
MLMPINGNISYFTYALVAVLGAGLCIKGEMSLGALASFLMFVRQYMGPISNLSQQFNGFMMALAGAERVYDLMDEPGETDEGKITLVNVEKEGTELKIAPNPTGRWAWKIPADDGSSTLVELKGDVRLKDVTFSYDGKKTVLQDISLYAKPGQKIAFVGSTGAGKTTITNLLNRFYDVGKGQITYDGIPINQIAKSDLRRSIGMVLQDTNLFSGTVMDNIRYGRLTATDEECIAAACRCNADSFIQRLPQGYQTQLTANGSNLSQGQRQLLNIARCAVADPPVMILDEATSSIDTHTERLIEKGMDELMKGRTTFVIAHRLSTVRNANAIIVLEHGQIVERGDHDDLLAQHGRYYQLYTGKADLD